jgi:RNA-directed DNA polymerase
LTRVAGESEHDRRIIAIGYLPGDLERQIDAFVEHYNHVRYHESINNLTPADVYFGRAETILAERERIKRATIANRRLQHQLQAA